MVKNSGTTFADVAGVDQVGIATAFSPAHCGMLTRPITMPHCFAMCSMVLPAQQNDCAQACSNSVFCGWWTQVKAEITEIVTFLRNPRKFLSMGARSPAGILLVGPPGVQSPVTRSSC